MPNFKPGQIVQLKTGGPRMVIADPLVIKDGVVTWWNCIWFTSINWEQERRAQLPTAVLKRAKAEED